MRTFGVRGSRIWPSFIADKVLFSPHLDLEGWSAPEKLYGGDHMAR